MDKNKSQIIFLNKSELETVAKALSSGCWTVSDSGHLEISNSPNASPSTCGTTPQLTLAQGNVRPVTQVSGAGGSTNNKTPAASEPSGLHRDTSQVTTLTELGKKLVEAARVGNTSQVRRLMAIGAPFASDGPIGMTPLHLASQNGHYETCDRLLSAGMNKDARNKVEKTPLHLAAMEGHTNIVHLLIKNGANVNACDMLKMTALHWACDRGHTSIVHLLLQHNAQVDLANKFFKTPLHLAIENRHDSITMALQGRISCKVENGEHKEGEEKDEGEEEEEEVVSLEATVLGQSSNIPAVCKTEEVHTELLVEEVYEDTEEEGHVIEDEHCLPTAENELPHTIMDDDLEDQNISVLATLAELAQATKSTGQSVEMSSNAAALELLKAQAALLPLDDSSALVTSAVAHGQTLHLTEAGRQALRLIKQELPLFPSSTLPKEKSKEEESVLTNKPSGSTDISSKDRPHSPSLIALPPPLSTLSSSVSSTSSSLLSTPSPVLSVSTSSLTSSSTLPLSSSSSLTSSSIPPSSLSSSTLLSSSPLPSPPPPPPVASSASLIHAASCFPVLLPLPHTDEETEEDQEVAQVITLTPEQYAALTNGASGPVILEVLPPNTTEVMSEGDVNPRLPASKRQKITQLVTRVPGSSGQPATVTKVSGQ